MYVYASESDRENISVMSGGNIELKVISSHKKAFNLVSVSGDFISVIAASDCCGPGRIMVPSVNFFPEFARGTVFLNKGEILFDELNLFFCDLSAAALWSEIVPSGNFSLPLFASRLSFAFQYMVSSSRRQEQVFFYAVNSGVFQPDFQPKDFSEDPVYSALHKFITAFFLSLDFKKVTESDVKKFVKGLVGFGYGLTPSGDDFLCGLLNSFGIMSAVFSESILPLARVVCLLDKAVSELTGVTVYISSVFLNYCLAGRIPQEALNFYDACVSGDESSLKKALNYYLEHGHSSGRETFLGMYTGFHYCCIYLQNNS